MHKLFLKYITFLFTIFLFCPVILSGRGREIVLNGLHKTDTGFMMNLVKNLMEETGGDAEKVRESLFDLDIFASVEYRINEDSVYFYFRELPSFLVFPAMKKTDQDGLLMGPGIVQMNLLGLGIKQMFLSRATVYPSLMKAKEFLYNLETPKTSSTALRLEILSEYFDTYNSLKLYDEKSFYNSISTSYSYTHFTQLRMDLAYLTVKKDPNVPYFRYDENIRMFYGEGEYDQIPSVGISHTIDLRDRVYNTHRGIYINTGAALSGKKLGGDGDFKVLTADLRLYHEITRKNILHSNLLGRYRPGTIPGYELYHIGGANSLRSLSPDPEIYGQHELLYTFEYRYEFFNHKQISILGMYGYYGLQFVIGNDHAHFWHPHDSFREGRHISSVYAGIHLLVPALERIRIEMGVNSANIREKTINFGINWGWYEKGQNQSNRVR